jgi:hypothetical protein
MARKLRVEYLKSVCDYVHLNPARAKLVAPDTPLKVFAGSSWPAYLLAPSKRPAWLRADRVLGEWGIPKDSPAACLCGAARRQGRQRLAQALEAQRGAEEGEITKCEVRTTNALQFDTRTSQVAVAAVRHSSLSR